MEKLIIPEDLRPVESVAEPSLRMVEVNDEVGFRESYVYEYEKGRLASVRSWQRGQGKRAIHYSYSGDNPVGHIITSAGGQRLFEEAHYSYQQRVGGPMEGEAGPGFWGWSVEILHQPVGGRSWRSYLVVDRWGRRETEMQGSVGQVRGYEYDSHGRLHCVVDYCNNRELRTVYTYGSGLLLSTETRDAAGHVLGESRFAHDAQSRPVKQVTRTLESGQWRTSERQLTYDLTAAQD